MTKATVTGLMLDVDGKFSTVDITDGLGSLQAAVDGLICGISFGRDLFAYGNDEGLYTQPHNAAATLLYSIKWGAYVQDLHGNVVFTGGTDDEGYDVSAPEGLQAELEALLAL